MLYFPNDWANSDICSYSSGPLSNFSSPPPRTMLFPKLGKSPLVKFFWDIESYFYLLHFLVLYISVKKILQLTGYTTFRDFNIEKDWWMINAKKCGMNKYNASNASDNDTIP